VWGKWDRKDLNFARKRQKREKTPRGKLPTSQVTGKNWEGDYREGTGDSGTKGSSREIKRGLCWGGEKNSKITVARRGNKS